MRFGVADEAQASDALLQQQRSLAQFGQFALQSDDLDAILHTACRLVGDALETDLAKVMALREDGETLLVRAGVGWKPGVVGRIVVDGSERASEGHALRTGEPVVSDDIQHDDRYTFAPFLSDHGVVSLANVAIPRSSGRPPFGVLQVDSRSPRHFTEQHVAFLYGYANLIGAAVERLDTVAANRLQQRALEESEQRSRLALEVGRLASWDWDLAGNHVAWSDEHYRMQGYAVGEVEPSFDAWAARVHPDDLPGTIAALEKARDTGTDYVHDLRNLLPGGDVRWVSARGRFFYDDGRAVRMIGMMQDISEQHRWAETQRTLIAELQHRTRNLLAVVRSIASQTMRGATTLHGFRGLFNERLAALSRVQGLLSHSESDPITIRRLIEMELEALGPIDDVAGRIVLDGPEIMLRNAMVQPLALAFHELATNARKYGALADGEGRLRVSWSLRDAGGAPHLCILWYETGIDGPDEADAARSNGFGRSLIEKALPYQLGGETDYRLTRNALHCTIAIPLGRKRKATAS